jgi:hypothetical protein
MGLQTIINLADSLTINRRKVVGIQYTRNEIARISEQPTRNPWRFTVNVGAMLPYENYRSLLEELDYLDRSIPEEITFSNNAKLSWMLAYQGVMTSGNINSVLVESFGTESSPYTSLVLNTLPSLSSSAILFKAGDFIQIENYPYPFTAVNTVTRGSGTSVTVTTHRGNFITDDVSLAHIRVGNAVKFKVFCPNMPTYTLVPGGKTALIKFDSAFELYEHTGDQV